MTPPLPPQIKRQDVEEAVRLWYGAMSGSAASPDGRPDMDNIYMGTTAERRQAQRALPDDLRAILQGEPRPRASMRACMCWAWICVCVI